MKQVKALVDQKLVDADSVKMFAGNQIVLVVPADSTLGITRLPGPDQGRRQEDHLRRPQESLLTA